MKIRLSEIVSAVRDQMATTGFSYESGHQHSRIQYLDPKVPLDGGGLVDASEVRLLSRDQRRSMMVLGPYGHVACGTDDAPIYYCGNQEGRIEMEKLQAILERRGRRLVNWRRLVGVVGFVLVPLVLIVGQLAVVAMTTDEVSPLAWLVTIAIGLVGTLLALGTLRSWLAARPRPHKLILP